MTSLECLPGLFSRGEEGRLDYHFSEASHASDLLKGLNRQRREGILCDVLICVGSDELPCHRNVLSACSQYFRAMFTTDMIEAVQKRVNISNIESSIMRQLIDYAYTSDITITQENAQALLSAANFIQLESIKEACCKFLEREMDPSNCLGIHCFAETHLCETLARKAKAYAQEHFKEVAQYDEVKLLPESKLIELVAADELGVDCEDIVLRTVVSWANYDREKRVSGLHRILENVRFAYVDPYFLFDQLDMAPFLNDTPECRTLVDAAKRYFVLKDRQVESTVARVAPRRNSERSCVLISVGGEIYNKTYLNSVDCYDMRASDWSRLKDLPFPRCHHAAVVSGSDSLYIAGGFNKDKTVLNSVMRYELAFNKWIRCADTAVPRARHGMATVDGYIYCVGGYEGNSRTNTVERYCPTTNTWTYVRPLSFAISRVQAASLHGQMYVCGGVVDPNNEFISTLQRYDPRADEWSILASMPSPRALAGLVSCYHNLYAVGGATDMAMATRQVTRYDPRMNKWEDCVMLTNNRYDAAVTSIEDKFYVVSGHDGENTFYSTIEEYDAVHDRFTILNNVSLPFGRCRFACVAMKVRRK